MIKVIPRISPSNIFYFIGFYLGISVLLSGESLLRTFIPHKDYIVYFSIFLLSIQIIGSVSRYKKKDLFFFLFFLLLSSIVSHRSGYYGLMLIYTPFLVMASKGIKFKEILKGYFSIGFSFALLNIIASSIGIISSTDLDIRVENTLMDLTGGLFSWLESQNRNSFGYGWCTNFANHIFYVITSFWLLFSKKDLWISVLIFFIGVFVLRYSDCRLSFLCIVLLSVLPFFIETIKERVFPTVVYRLIIIVIPIFCLASYLVTFFYDRSNLIWFIINNILTRRLTLGQDMLEEYGISLWGQKVEMYSSVINDGVFYNYIDSSYLQMLIIYGLVYTLLVIYMYVKISSRAIQMKEYYILFAIIATGISGLICQHFIQIYMNPLLIAYMADIRNSEFSK